MSQPWDVPLFGEPVQSRTGTDWVLSKRDEEDLLKPRWQRYRGPMVPCAESHPDPRQRCRPVTWLRIIGKEETPLCSLHKQEYLDNQTLAAPRGQ